MKKNIHDQVIKLLQDKHISYEHLYHKEAKTSSTAVLETNSSLSDGIKSLILRGKKSSKNYLVCVLGSQKIDMKNFAQMVSEGVELEKPQVIKEKFDLEIGSIPPFGFLLDLPTYFDKSILENQVGIFASGLSTESIRMQIKDLISLTNPIIGSFSKIVSE